MAEQLRCSVCGRYFTPQRGLIGDVLQQTTGLPGLVGKHVCPECKRAQASGGGGASAGGILGTLLHSTDAEVQGRIESQAMDQVDAENRNKISDINISGSADEIQMQLNNLVSRAAGLNAGYGGNSNDKQTMNVIKEKLEFGIMKLRSMGNTAEADYFQDKLDSFNPLKKITKLFSKKK